MYTTIMPIRKPRTYNPKNFPLLIIIITAVIIILLWTIMGAGLLKLEIIVVQTSLVYEMTSNYFRL